ncbi:MAG: hypothetical protein KBC33_00535 [Candidatus Pacebacteria bacterium]|nr:hypothetical protein [Candidatus Paceibacterota bacterium]
MKKTPFGRFSKKHAQSAVPVDRGQLILKATNITLKQYAKTFKDLALYDRAKQVAR